MANDRRIRDPSELVEHARALLTAWAIVSVLALTALGIGIAVSGPEFFYRIQGPADASRVEVKFLVFAIAWGWLGAGLALLQRKALLRRHAAFATVWFLLGLGYLNVVRGPHAVPHQDFAAYFTAALRMREGLPMTDDPFLLYLYPPLLATVLGPLVPLGLGTASWLFRFANYGALLVFAWLLYLVLQRLGAARPLAGMIVLIALAANIAIADTLAAQQVNLYGANLVLASLLLVSANEPLSALALALGAHLKVYPVLLVLPFLWLGRWRWGAWFGVWAVVVIVATSAANGFAYYLQFLQQLPTLTEHGLRNASLPSLLYNSGRLLGPSLGSLERPVAMGLQLAAAALVVWWGRRALRDGLPYHDGIRDQRHLAAGFAVLSLAMLVVSPSIWVHHGVFAIFPAVTLALNVSQPRDAVLLGVAWFLVFLVPVHELYPFSYLRFVGLLMLAYSFRRVADERLRGCAPLLALWRSDGPDTGANRT